MNSLKIYEEYLKAGFTEEQAKLAGRQYDNIFNRIKDEFASNKVMAIIGSLIIAIGGFTLAKVIDLDKRVAIVEHIITQNNIITLSHKPE